METMPIKNDAHYAAEVRLKIEALHRIIREATEHGLNISIDLNGIGKPTFAYKDIVKIVRIL